MPAYVTLLLYRVFKCYFSGMCLVATGGRRIDWALDCFVARANLIEWHVCMLFQSSVELLQFWNPQRCSGLCG